MTRSTNHGMPSWRYREIDRTAVDFLAGFNLTHMPISGFELAQLMGITISAYPKHECAKRDAIMAISEDAFTVTSKDGTTIFYNDGPSYERINFSLMHEICHIVLGHREHSRLAEKEVNHMAGYMLASPILIETLHISSTEELSQQCHISLQCARYRMRHYQGWRSHLVYNGQKLLPHERKLLKIIRTTQSA